MCRWDYNLSSGPLWSWSYDSWIYIYLCNQCLSPLVWIWTPLRRGVLDTTLCDKVCQWFMTGWWFSPGTLVSSTNKTDRHDITEILLKIALSIIKPNQTVINVNGIHTSIDYLLILLLLNFETELNICLLLHHCSLYWHNANTCFNWNVNV